MDTISGFSGKPYEKTVEEKDYRNRKNGVHGARSDTTLSENLRYPPGPVPVHVPLNCQTACDDRLKAGPLRGDRPAPGFSLSEKIKELQRTPP